MGRGFDELRAELQGIPGALHEIVICSDVIPGIHLVLPRPLATRKRGE